MGSKESTGSIEVEKHAEVGHDGLVKNLTKTLIDNALTSVSIDDVIEAAMAAQVDLEVACV